MATTTANHPITARGTTQNDYSGIESIDASARKPSKRQALHTSKSFSRLESSPQSSPTRSHRASTIQNGSIARMSPGINENLLSLDVGSEDDLFEGGPDVGSDRVGYDGELSGRLFQDGNELPDGIVSLTDSFISSLTAKVHVSPPSVDQLSSMFQDFYTLAATHIESYLSGLASQRSRETSPAPSMSSRTSATSKIRAKTASMTGKEYPKASTKQSASDDQQMLTAEELAERKRFKKSLQQKRMLLEEAVERRVCEAVYDRIWRHRSTQDEAQDEKLRSKTAALSVVGIGLVDLGVDLGIEDPKHPANDVQKEAEVKEWLKEARDELLAMNDKRYPLGKLHHLKAAHKAIVDTLSHFHPSSSADEIMPMMIYTLITSPTEHLNVISNLYFMQRFRSGDKIDGEAAYCLTNLEAAITFLETVDLASLRADEVLSGPPKANSRPSSPRVEELKIPGLTRASLSPAAISPLSTEASQVKSSTLRPAMTIHNRRISELFQPPAQAIGAAGDAMLSTADQGFKTIGNSLGDSYKFLLGKLKERQENVSEDDLVVPKTLDDARKLIHMPPPPDDDASASEASSLHATEVPVRDDKMLSIIGGRKVSRDRSVDSARSSNSGKRVGFAEDSKAVSSPLSVSPLATANPAIVESMRNVANTLNPMNRFAGIGMMRGFGRSAPSTPTTPTTESDVKIPDGGVTELTTAFPHLAGSLTAKETAKTAPPIKRFMDIQNPGDLKISEVLELLRDYRRLAGVLKDMGAV